MTTNVPRETSLDEDLAWLHDFIDERCDTGDNWRDANATLERVARAIADLEVDLTHAVAQASRVHTEASQANGVAVFDTFDDALGNYHTEQRVTRALGLRR